MARLPGARERIHQSLFSLNPGAAVSSPRKRTRTRAHVPPRSNPIEQFRAPWKMLPDEPRTQEVTWRSAFFARGDVGVIEVRPIERDSGAAEVIVYVVQLERFPELRPNADVAMDIDWVRENASRIVRGEVGEREVFCIRHHSGGEECTPSCDLTDKMHSGWRGLLWSFLNQEWTNDNLLWSTPVIVDDGLHGGTYVTDLNHASLPTAELRNCHAAIKNDALAVKDYEEKNTDSVSDIPNAANEYHLADVLLGTAGRPDRPNFSKWVSGHSSIRREDFNTGPNMPPAVEKWFDIVYRLAHLADSDHVDDFELTVGDAMDVRQQFRKDLAFELVQSSDIYTLDEYKLLTKHPMVKEAERKGEVLSDGWLEGLEYPEHDLKFLVYTRDETRQLLPTDQDGVIEDEIFDDLTAALDREDITWSREDPYSYSVQINAHWIFTVDVDTLNEQLTELIYQYAPPEED